MGQKLNPYVWFAVTVLVDTIFENNYFSR